MADLTPIPQDSSTDPQVPGNYPGTVQNPTQVPAPVSPASDPEVPPLPNDVDPNFIPNPAPVDNTINPEVPQPEENFAIKKKFDAEPVVPVTNPEVPQPQDFGSEPPTGFPPAQDFGSDPQIGLPPAQDFGEEARISDFPPAQDFGVDPQVPAAQDFGSDPRIIVPDAQDFGVDPQVPATPIVQNYFTDANPVVPASDTGFDDFYGEQTYTVNYTGTADVRPVFPAANPQVPNIFSSISALLSNLFGITPTPVAPAANPQVAQAFPVPAPTVFKPTPIPPAANPQVVQQPTIVQNYFTDRTPAVVVPAANPQVPLAQDFGSEPPIVVPTAQDYGSDPQIGVPPAQDFGSEPPTVIPPAQDYGSDPQIGLPPPQDFGGRKKADPDIVDSPSEPAVQSQAQTRIEGPVNQVVLQQSNPAAAANYNKDFLDAKNEIVTSQIRELEATQGSPATERQIAGIDAYADAPARFIVNNKYKDQIEAADAAQSVPANTPPPTIVPADVNVPALPNDADPNFISNPGPVDNTIDPEVPSSANVRVENVNQSALAQKDPALYQQWQETFTARAERDAANEIKVVEAELGRPVSAEERATIESVAAFRARSDTNAIYKDELQAANVATVVPADTPPPTTNPATVTNNPQVVVPQTKIVAVSTETLLQNDPETAQEYTAFKAETAAQLTEQRIAEREAVEGGPISVSEQVQIAARSEIDATADANFRYQDQIQAAGAGTTVPADTPPPAPAPVAVTNNPQVVVPPTRVVAVSTETLLQNDPVTAQEYTAFKTETAQELTAQRIAEREAVEGGPISVSEQVQIAARAEIDATADANFRYQDQIQAADAGTTVPADTPPPTVTAPPVDSATNQQVPAATGKIENFSFSTLAIEDPETAKALITDQRAIQQDLANQQVAEYRAVTGTAPGTPIPDEELARITTESDLAAKAQVQTQYQDQIVAAGAGTLIPTDTPPPSVVPPAQDFGVDPQVPAAQDFGQEPPIVVPEAQDFGVDPQVPAAQDFGVDTPTVAPAPPSPSPYEIFLAQEAAATDAAQAEATARFNSQFDVVTEDPQVPLAQDFGQEPPIEVPDAQDFGVDPQAQDFGTDADFNIGEFQSEPVDIPTIDTGYDDFYGNQEDVGEFQAEPVDIPTIDTGYDDFYGNEEDVGEFQAEPSDVDSGDTGFSDFSDTGGGDGGDFFGGLFGGVKRSAGAVSGGSDPFAGILDGLGSSIPLVNPKTTLSPQQLAANRQKAAKALAKQQNIINQQQKQVNDGDWRVRLRLAGSADYLYNAPNPGILAPLSKSGSDGVIFPYTPAITTAYQAKYNAYELTHSNYKGYFYQGSSVGDISINATFTAQDTQEANYLLAVIHFFRSVTKMFYGQDDSAHRGAPPPLVFLQGLGEYQFNRHPCVVTNFNYTLPADVDYIRALSPNNDGTNLSNRRSLQSGVTPFINPSVSRLQNAGLPQGGLYTPPAPPSLGTNSPTYVPTKMDIQITLLAIQTRSQVSKQFSLKEFANGNLVKGGFW